MAQIFTIPIPLSRPNQSVFVTLDGRRYRLDLTWNARLERWALSIRSGTGADLLLNKLLVVGADILRTARYNSDLPNGALAIRDLQNLGTEAGLASLGVTHALTFIPRASIPVA